MEIKEANLIKEKLSKLIWLDKFGKFKSITDSGNLIFELMDIFSFERFDDIARQPKIFLRK